MSARGWIVRAAVLVAMAAAALPARGESFLLSGDDQAAWLVINDVGGYRLATKPVNLPWELSGEAGTGRVTAIAPTPDGAVLLFAGGGVVKYYRSQGPRTGARAPASLWPEGVGALAACAMGGPRADGVLVVINRPVRGGAASGPAATTTASGPATRRPARTTFPQVRRFLPAGQTEPARRELALLRYAGDQWDQVALVPAELAPPATGGQMVAAGETVYLLLDLPQPALLAMAQGQWRAIPLPAELNGMRPLALAALDKGLVVAACGPGSVGRVLVVLLAEGQWQPAQPVRPGPDQTNWPEAPAVGRLGQRIAFAWKDGAAWKFGTCGTEGQLFPQPLVLSPPGKSGQLAGRVQEAFFWSALVLVIVLMLARGQTRKVGPFTLPPEVSVARPGRRALAFLIDFVPINVLALAATGQRDLQGALDAAAGGAPPDWLILSFVGALGVYCLYVIIMEYLHGATLGKMALRLAVVGDDGARPTLRQVVLRNLTKIPELWTVILLLFPLFTRYRQRLGDVIARTAVIDAQSQVRPPASAGEHQDQQDDGGDGSEPPP